MSNKVVFNFTDECGVYEKNRTRRFCEANPFYVRSNFMIGVDDYRLFEQKMNNLKSELGIP